MLGVVAPKLDLTCDAKSRRLLRFIGLTDLRDDCGKPLQARINLANAPTTADASARARVAPRCMRAR